MRILLFTVALAGLVACSSGPTIRTDQDPAANFDAYRTYDFVDDVGTDRAGYSTLVTAHFKNAVSRELAARGFRQSSQNPDVLVNFFTSMRERTETSSSPGVFLGTQYYRTRQGVYTAWPLYGRDVSTTTYRIGTASVDLVDAQRKQLVWEGVAEGTLTDKVMENPGPSIDKAVREIFARYPVKPDTAR